MGKLDHYYDKTWEQHFESGTKCVEAHHWDGNVEFEGNGKTDGDVVGNRGNCEKFGRLDQYKLRVKIYEKEVDLEHNLSCNGNCSGDDGVVEGFVEENRVDFSHRYLND